MPRDAGSVGRFRRATRFSQELRLSFLKPKISSILLLVCGFTALWAASFLADFFSLSVPTKAPISWIKENQDAKSWLLFKGKSKQDLNGLIVLPLFNQNKHSWCWDPSLLGVALTGNWSENNNKQLCLSLSRSLSSCLTVSANSNLTCSSFSRLHVLFWVFVRFCVILVRDQAWVFSLLSLSQVEVSCERNVADKVYVSQYHILPERSRRGEERRRRTLWEGLECCEKGAPCSLADFTANSTLFDVTSWKLPQHVNV